MRTKIRIKMFETSLTENLSENIQNEVQEIDITSKIIKETYVSFTIFLPSIFN